MIVHGTQQDGGWLQGFVVVSLALNDVFGIFACLWLHVEAAATKGAVWRCCTATYTRCMSPTLPLSCEAITAKLAYMG